MSSKNKPASLGCIAARGIKTHNLKGIDIDIPYRQLIVVTGLSGSGKSSFAFDTLFAEGRRRYVESFSAYVRQFLGRIERPPVDTIQGVLPSIGMKQKTHTSNPRACVGTTTDIYAYLTLLYARVGITYSPISGDIVKRDTVEDVYNYIARLPIGSKVLIFSLLAQRKDRTWDEILTIELGKGFTRLLHEGKIVLIEDLLKNGTKNLGASTYIIIDRLIVKEGMENMRSRILDSVKTAFFEGMGSCTIEIMGGARKDFSDRFEADGQTFEAPSVSFFNFNNPHGACKKCMGWGRCMGIVRAKVIPNPSLSIAEGTILPWQSATMKEWQEKAIGFYRKKNIPIYRSYKDLTAEEKKIIWEGDEEFGGIHGFFDWLSTKSYKVQYRILHARYRGFKTCPDCKGSGLRPDVDYVKIAGKSLIDLSAMPITELYHFFSNTELPAHHKKVGDILIEEITKRLYYLCQVGLGYLTLNRRTGTLSGGEYQRVRLARAIGSALVDALYVLDEPTIGLHPRDTANLIRVLVGLKEAGNTVVVVEHEEMLMEVADQIIDIGPEAGFKGGELIFQGTWQEILKEKKGHTGNYLAGRSQISMPSKRRDWQDSIIVENIRKHNLHGVNVEIPLEVLTVVTGVSGSGKSTLIEKVFYPAACAYLGIHSSEKTGNKGYENVKGNLKKIQQIEYIGQDALAKSSRSSPVTYVKAFDEIRKIFASQPLALERSYSTSFFSFNTPGGRCEACVGEGYKKIEMQFMADISLKCEDCQGKRFKKEVLEVSYLGKNITDILEMTINEALLFFKEHAVIVSKLMGLEKVGVGYLRLGQPSSTFSGGEAQRVKLSLYLNQEKPTPTLFIFDEPTTGLHFHDIKKLMKAFQQLIDKGHTVLVIEHNTDVIKCADWLIDLGPEGGKNGGKIIFTGTPEEIVKLSKNHTGHYLKSKLQSS